MITTLSLLSALAMTSVSRVPNINVTRLSDGGVSVYNGTYLLWISRGQVEAERIPPSLKSQTGAAFMVRTLRTRQREWYLNGASVSFFRSRRRNAEWQQVMLDGKPLRLGVVPAIAATDSNALVFGMTTGTINDPLEFPIVSLGDEVEAKVIATARWNIRGVSLGRMDFYDRDANLFTVDADSKQVWPVGIKEKVGFLDTPPSLLGRIGNYLVRKKLRQVELIDAVNPLSRRTIQTMKETLVAITSTHLWMAEDHQSGVAIRSFSGPRTRRWKIPGVALHSWSQWRDRAAIIVRKPPSQYQLFVVEGNQVKRISDPLAGLGNSLPVLDGDYVWIVSTGAAYKRRVVQDIAA